MNRSYRFHLLKQLEGYEVAGRFVLDELIGVGGMAGIFRATQLNVHRPVAIKIIPANDPIVTARFTREASLVSKLRHPNNVTMFDFGHTTDGYLFLAMELLRGETLGQRLSNGPIPLKVALKIADQLCMALDEAHTHGIVHRDIKPDNIFLIAFKGDESFVKVSDFGIAKSIDAHTDPNLTGAGNVIGTPRYMSPEQILGGPVDPRSDIYSLGCVLYQMFSGQPPFRSENSAAVMIQHTRDMPSKFSEVAPDRYIPKHIEHVVRCMMAKRPEDRPQTMDAVRLALREHVDVPDRLPNIEAKPRRYPTFAPLTALMISAWVLIAVLVAASAISLTRQSNASPADRELAAPAEPNVATFTTTPTTLDKSSWAPETTRAMKLKRLNDNRSAAKSTFSKGSTSLRSVSELLEADAATRVIKGDSIGALEACAGIPTVRCARIEGTAYKTLGRTAESCAAFSRAGMRPAHCK